MHTKISDGVWSPDELFAYIRSSKITHFSVTDHDTMEIYPLPADLAARAVRGMEVDTKHRGQTVHILTYGIDDPNSPLLVQLREQRIERRARMEQMVERVRSLGIEITLDDVLACAGDAASLGRPHLARALVNKGIVSTIQEAFDRYLADDGTGYVALDRLDSATAIRLAHESGALAVVAHPCRLRDAATVDELRALGLDGVEAIHPSADPAQQQAWFDYAAQHGILATGGSDFHSPETNPLPGVDLPETNLEQFLSMLGKPML